MMRNMEKRILRSMKKYMYPAVIGLCMTACSETFPGIEAEVVEKDYNSSEITSDRLPILVSYTDPNYVILTRGSGPFENYIEDQDHWRNAEFHVFAYKVPNDIDPKYDFSRGNDGQNRIGEQNNENLDYCLLYNRIAKLKSVAQSESPEDDYVALDWKDKERFFYNSDHQDYKYNFYLAHVDDALQGNWITTSDRVYGNLRLDGTQDVITSVARPGEKKKESLKGEQYKALLENWDNLIYSTYAAHRGIQPQFDVRHNLVRLSFSVLLGDPKANGVVLKDIALLRPRTRAQLTVAALDVTQVGLVALENERDDLSAWHLQEAKDIRESEDYVIRGDTLLKPLQLQWDGDENTVQQEQKVGTSFLAIPGESYTIQLTCVQEIEDKDGNPKTVLTRPTYEIRLKGENNVFAAGQEYKISVKVYGIQDIELFLGANGWVNAEEVPIDPDDLNGNNTYDIVDRTEDYEKQK